MTGYFPDLLAEYKQLLQQMRQDGVTSGDLYAEVKQAVEWMETGYDPAEFRAATRVDAFPMDPYHMQTYLQYLDNESEMLPDHLTKIQKQIISDFYYFEEEIPVMFATDFVSKFFEDFRWLSKNAIENKDRINFAFAGLTANEKAAFIAVRAENMPFSKVAKMFGVSKSTVQKFVERATEKIEKNQRFGSQSSLFDEIA